MLPSSCPSNTNISITVTASNKLGKGPPSDPVTIGKLIKKCMLVGQIMEHSVIKFNA